MILLADVLVVDWTQIILAVIALIGMLTPILVPILVTSRRAASAAEKAITAAEAAKTTAEETKTTSKETHQAVNHRMDTFLKELADKNAELLKAAVAEARKEGVRQTEDTIKAVALTVKNEEGPLEVKVVNTPTEKVPVEQHKTKPNS